MFGISEEKRFENYHRQNGDQNHFFHGLTPAQLKRIKKKFNQSYESSTGATPKQIKWCPKHRDAR
jgi:hypothetical protein